MKNHELRYLVRGLVESILIATGVVFIVLTILNYVLFLKDDCDSSEECKYVYRSQLTHLNSIINKTKPNSTSRKYIVQEMSILEYKLGK